MCKLVWIGALAALAAPAEATIFAVGLGAGAPVLPPTLTLGGLVTVSQLPVDPGPYGYTPTTFIVGGAAIPGGITLSPTHLRARVPEWPTWARGRTPVIYYSNGATTTTYTFGSALAGVAFWVEPNFSAPYQIVATASDGTTLRQTPDSFAGALGYAFYSDSGAAITSVTLTQTGHSADYAVAEWYGAVPEPGSLGLLGLGALAFFRRR